MSDGKEPAGQSWLKRLFGERAAPAPTALQPVPPERIPSTDVIQLPVEEVLLAFIEDEDYAVAADKQGYLWPSHHGLIASYIPKARAHLPEERRAQAYMHYMRLNRRPPSLPENEFPQLVAAYRELLPLLDHRAGFLAQRHDLLFCFGFDETGTLPNGATTGAGQLKDYRKLIMQCQKYTSLPGQRAKMKNFLPFAHHGDRLYQTLKHLGYHHDRRYGDKIWSIDLVFWGMVLTILLNEERRADLLHDLLDGDDKIPFKDENLSLLHKTAQAVLAAYPTTDARFLDLAARLASTQTAKA